MLVYTITAQWRRCLITMNGSVVILYIQVQISFDVTDGQVTDMLA